MRIKLLGPFEVQTDDGAAVKVPGDRLRALLAGLALEPGRIIPRARLVDWVWGEESPSDEVNALQVLVSRLRRVLPDGAVEAKSGGYRLVADPEAVDAARFDHLVSRAREAEDTERADLLRTALELWRGDAFEGIELQGSRAFDAAIAGLGERRLAVLGDRVDAEIRLGRGADLVSELTDLVAKYPLREGFVAALMRALAEAGRGAEALTEYRRLSERLADELGADPSPELSALHTALLRGEIGGRAESRRTNLRAELTTFVGKDDDVAAVADLAAGHRLVTLTGAGGSGKTRTASEAARRMLGDLPDGAWMVELAPLRDGGDLAQAALSAIGLRDQTLADPGAGGDPAGRLTAAIRDRVMLLVLDNCEHLIEDVSRFADRLLGECRRLRIIATSREPLGITGEALWQVEPLALPPEEADPAQAAASPSVRLLRDRAEAVRRNIGSDRETLSTMARICRALDGMPLAIELAAARLRTMSVEQLADRLDDRFKLLTGGSRTALPRHRTLRAVVDWSWDLLGAEERELLMRLSVFTGGASLEAAERICPEGEYALDLLTALTEKSLLVSYGEAAPRYRMLGTVREYAAQRLAEAGESESARRAHLAFVTDLAETADPHLRRSEQLAWLPRLEAEHDNITAALRGAIADDRAEEAMRLAGAAGWYWFLSGHRAEGTELSVAAASLEGEVPDDVRALAYAVVTLFLTSGAGGDQYRAQEWILETHRLAQRLETVHPLLRTTGPLERMLREPTDFLSSFAVLIDDDDPWVRAGARLGRARMRLTFGSDETGVDDDVEVALAQFREIGDRWGSASALSFQAERLAARGDLERACEYCEEAIAALTELGATEDVISARARQSHLYWMLGDERSSAEAMAEARRLADGITWPDTFVELAVARARLARWRGDTAEARELLEAIRARSEGAAIGVQIMVHTLSGDLAEDLDRARGHWAEALDAVVRMAHPPSTAQALTGIADLALRAGSAEGAARLLAAAEAVRGTPDRSQPDTARIEDEARRRLGEEAFAEATREGRERDWRELAEAALA